MSDQKKQGEKKIKKTPKKQRKDKLAREDNVNALKQHAREFIFQYNPQIIDLTKNEEECRKATTGVCLRPDIFLNNHRSCHNCSIYEFCACSSKHIDKKYLKKSK